ncbi:LEAF RUST 10 DISEASE-RESISTANCE LOCUS RECEPTOR-LIKE PROTEIN KINASE-like 2.4 [Arachis stenosperma]|uniref:LEAF RUST 10 DISEASE-RESISTANCE LOCUS RECEPTOR-LIKE PROTEIN KINASE-like 2.4 n=1 Tax=Arachis stenosperma TaxID=217475 RepID=UPI0025AC2802|nr:LEAF RUST 10 DISEASE-RESISTANCE LOCUS RECEPTOR-LIKE PROTEIN KINASE-like 2.4 [Arachis stenosperma]
MASLSKEEGVDKVRLAVCGKKRHHVLGVFDKVEPTEASSHRRRGGGNELERCCNNCRIVEYLLHYIKVTKMKLINSFNVKLGQSGFGVVYKGKLSDGSNVAVKMLNPFKENGKIFINEEASINRTSHVNVVTLFRFCFDGRKKVPIYEFILNGSLDKFIYRKEGVETTTLLSWDKLYQIANQGIVWGLEYLHRGCDTQILHFDIKPHNILLDENFCSTISDFELEKLYAGNESLISMSNARGTIGYIASEVWSRHFGNPYHKSDVYSYGMMLLDIVGGKKNINLEGSQTSEIFSLIGYTKGLSKALS